LNNFGAIAINAAPVASPYIHLLSAKRLVVVPESEVNEKFMNDLLTLPAFRRLFISAQEAAPDWRYQVYFDTLVEHGLHIVSE
jgi:hypothetical protein